MIEIGEPKHYAVPGLDFFGTMLGGLPCAAWNYLTMIFWADCQRISCALAISRQLLEDWSFRDLS